MKPIANKSENPECTCENCGCNPCTCSSKMCCSSDGKSCCLSGHRWVGATFRIIIVVLMIVGAYAWGVWNGAGYHGGYGRYGQGEFGYKNVQGGMMRRGAMMGQYTDTDDQYAARRASNPQTGIVQMMSGTMMGGSGETMQERMVNMSMANMSRMLEGMTGDTLDQTFLEAMIPHHQAAIDMAKYLAGSKHPELVKLGTDIITAQSKEIDQMKAWQKAWGYTK